MLFMGKAAYAAARKMTKEKLEPMKEALIRIANEDREMSFTEIMMKRKKEEAVSIDKTKRDFCEFMADSLNESLKKETLAGGMGIPNCYVTADGLDRIIDEYIESKMG